MVRIKFEDLLEEIINSFKETSSKKNERIKERAIRKNATK
mgnify:CR=1 FL=1